MYIFITKGVIWTILLFVTLALCQKDWEEIRPSFMTGKFVTTSHTTLRPFSQIQCVDRCFREAKNGRCSVAGYNKTAQSCHLSTGNNEITVDVADVSSGVFVVQLEPTGLHRMYISPYNHYYWCSQNDLYVSARLYMTITYLLKSFEQRMFIILSQDCS